MTSVCFRTVERYLFVLHQRLHRRLDQKGLKPIAGPGTPENLHRWRSQAAPPHGYEKAGSKYERSMARDAFTAIIKFPTSQIGLFCSADLRIYGMTEPEMRFSRSLEILRPPFRGPSDLSSCYWCFCSTMVQINILAFSALGAVVH